MKRKFGGRVGAQAEDGGGGEKRGIDDEADARIHLVHELNGLVEGKGTVLLVPRSIVTQP
jgi:hypothetical protein